MNTENSNTSKPHRFRLTLADKRKFKRPGKTWHQVIQVLIIHGKTLNLHIKQ